jgi:hypothetical protein
MLALSSGLATASERSAAAATWVKTTPGTPGEETPAFVSTVFDSDTGQVLRVGGTQGTWAWDGRSWARLAAPGEPPDRAGPIAAYDGATGQVVLFGGVILDQTVIRAVNYFDTWTWNGTRWSQQHPTTTPTMTSGCAGYNPTTKQFLMVGGSSSGMEAWSWTGSDWESASVASLPPMWSGCSMTYDPARQTLVLLMDSIQTAGPALWAWSGSSWSLLSSNMPHGSIGSFVYDGDLAAFVTDLDVPTGSPPFVWQSTQPETFVGDAGSMAVMSSSDAPAAAVPLSYDAATHQLLALDTSGSTPTTWIASTHDPSTATPARVFGSDRESTAVAVSQAAFPDAASADAVVLARRDAYPDALAGGPLAMAKHAPLLLTSSASLDPVTQAEIQRVLAPGGTVYLLGGTSALSDAVSNAVSALGYQPVRLAGSDRFATAVSIAQELGNPATVYEASGTGFADALSAVPAAAAQHGAILLTDGKAQAGATGKYLAAHPGLHFAVGGPAAEADPSARPMIGADRYATSEIVALAAFPSASRAFVASSANFPDALAGGPWAASVDAPVLLAPPSGTLPGPIGAYLSTHTLTDVTVLGGNTAVSDSVISEVATALAQ